VDLLTINYTDVQHVWANVDVDEALLATESA
jgi:hypothetical protein